VNAFFIKVSFLYLKYYIKKMIVAVEELSESFGRRCILYMHSTSREVEREKREKILLTSY
jgi:hypothetical protein